MLEIFLVIAAWKKGWRWKALLPPLVAYLTIFTIGGAVAASGGDSVAILVLCILGEFIALGIMAFRAPSKVRIPDKPQAEAELAAADEAQLEH